MGTLLALVGFSFVSSVTPGPNNVLLWASGATFGFRATIPHVIGTALGIGSMALVMAAGVGTLFTAIPAIELAMKAAASAYLVVLAVRIAGSHAFERARLARPLGIVGAAAFQGVNPKAWVFVLGAVTAFRPPGYPVVAGSVLVALTMATVVVPTAALWAGGGGILGRLMTGDRARRSVSLALALLLVGTIASVWL